MAQYLLTDTVGSDIAPLSSEVTPLRKRPSMFEPPTGKGWDTLTEKEKVAKLRALQEECLRKEREIIRLINLRNTFLNKRLPTGVLSDAIALFKPQIIRSKKLGNPDEVTYRWIQHLMDEYQVYRSAYPNDPGAEYFMPLPKGRPAGQLLTDDQKSVIRYALAKRSRLIRSAHGKVRDIDVPFSILDVYSYAKSIHPIMPSYNTVRRYVRDFQNRKPALFKMITEGEDVVERELLQKKRNDVMRPNQRWLSDARDLPWYVKHNGKIYRLCIIIIYDDYSGYIVWWRLLMKEEANTDSNIKRSRAKKMNKESCKIKRSRSTTFTGEDVVSLLLTAMYRTGIFPEEIYTDNGSQYIKAERLMANLRGKGDRAIIWRHSRPWKPWGRGKVEGALGKLRSLLSRVPGTYSKHNRRSIGAARKHPDLYTYEEAVDEVAKHFTYINERPRKRAPSRFAVWQSSPSLKAPPIRSMALVNGVDVVQQLVALDDWGISFDGDKWEPKNVEGQNRRIYRLLGDAIASGNNAWLSAVRIDTGWKVEIQLQGEWVEFVRKSTQQGDSQHNDDQASTLKELRDERYLMLKSDYESIKRISSTYSIQEASSGEYTTHSTQEDLQSHNDIFFQESDNSIIPTNENFTSHTTNSELASNNLTDTSENEQTPQKEISEMNNPDIEQDKTPSSLTRDIEQDKTSSSLTRDKETNNEEILNSNPNKKGKTNQNRTKNKIPTNSTTFRVDSDDDLEGLPDFTQITEQIKSQAK